MCRDLAVQGVVPQTKVERQFPNGPLVLREHSDFGRVLDQPERLRPDDHRGGRLVAEGIGDGAVDGVGVRVRPFQALVPSLVVEADFEVMRPGDIGRRQAACDHRGKPPLVGPVPVICPRIRASEGTILEVQAQIGHRDVVGPHVRHQLGMFFVPLQ